MTRQRVNDHGPARKYWTQVPNLVDDSDLDPYARALLIHYIRIAGQRDTCEETVRDSAQRCRMSPASVIRAREILVRDGWIEIEDVGGHGRGALLRIHLLDRWSENMERYSGKSRNVSVANNSREDDEECSPGERNVSVANENEGIVRVANKVLHQPDNSNGAVFLKPEEPELKSPPGEEARAPTRATAADEGRPWKRPCPWCGQGVRPFGVAQRGYGHDGDCPLYDISASNPVFSLPRAELEQLVAEAASNGHARAGPDPPDREEQEESTDRRPVPAGGGPAESET